MKQYKLKETVRLRLHGAILIALAYCAHLTNSDGAACMFGIMGGIMLCQNINLIPHCIYRISKYIYRKWRWLEIYGK